MLWLKRAALGLAALYVAALGIIWLAQRALLFLPNPAQTAPDVAGFAGAQSLALTTADNEHLIAWYRPALATGRFILYFHGNGGNLSREARRIEVLASEGMGVLAVDYRGYGGSSGYPTETGLLLDAEASYAKAIALGIKPDNLILYGHSLGSGLAVAMAARHKAAALVLEAPFSAAVDVAEERYWMFPVRAMMRDQFHSDERIKAVTAPILMLHGEDDGTIPIRFGVRLFALAPEPKTFMRLPGAGHLLLQEPGVAQRVQSWMAAAVPQ